MYLEKETGILKRIMVSEAFVIDCLHSVSLQKFIRFLPRQIHTNPLFCNTALHLMITE
jgi:hypothetical protein